MSLKLWQIYVIRSEMISRHNRIIVYSPISARQSLSEEPESHWLESQQRLNRWGGRQAMERLEQLGQIANTD